MKKLLALVLALVMVMSLCVTSNAAFSGEEYDYDEAVEVMAAVGVFEGDENGKFNGQAELTREQAAKLVAYLDLGKKVAEALPAVKVFNDVEADRWSAKYVAYCADAGYIAGVGDGSFDPTGKLTGYAFGKMLLCVLGYDAKIEGFTGASWTIKVAKLMESNDINDGVETLASAALTREQAAQYCYNALLATMVEYEDKGTSVSVNGAEIVTSAKAAHKVTVAASVDEKIKNDNYKQLGEKLYGTDLKFNDNTVTDDLGCPAEKWTYKAEEVGTYATAADKVVVSEKAYDDVLDLYVDVVDDDYDYDYDASGAEFGLAVSSNKVGTAVAAGDVVRFYLNDEDVITKAVITEYKLGKITKVDTKVSKADAEDDVTAYLNITDVVADTAAYTKIKDTKVEGFNASTFVKNAYILYAVGAKDAAIIADSALAQTVEGKVASIKGSKATIGGTAYKVLASATVDLNDEGTFYLNKANQIVVADTESESDNYAFVYYTKVEANKVNSAGIASTVVTVYLVDAEGNLASYTVDSDYVDQFNAGYQGVIAYSVNADDELELEDAKDDLGGKILGQTISKSAANGTDSATKFVFAYADGSKMKTKTAVGYKNVNIAATDAFWKVCDDDDVLYVFVYADNGTLSSDVQYAVVLDDSYSSYKEDKNVFYTFSVAVDGEETSLTFKNMSAADRAVMQYAAVFAFSMDGDNAVLESDRNLVSVATNKVTALTDDYVIIDGTQYNLDETVVYQVVKELDEDNDIDVVTVSTVAGSDVKTADLKAVSFVLDNDDIDTLFLTTELSYY